MTISSIPGRMTSAFPRRSPVGGSTTSSPTTSSPTTSGSTSRSRTSRRRHRRRRGTARACATRPAPRARARRAPPSGPRAARTRTSRAERSKARPVNPQFPREASLPALPAAGGRHPRILGAVAVATRRRTPARCHGGRRRPPGARSWTPATTRTFSDPDHRHTALGLPAKLPATQAHYLVDFGTLAASAPPTLVPDAEPGSRTRVREFRQVLHPVGFDVFPEQMPKLAGAPFHAYVDCDVVFSRTGTSSRGAALPRAFAHRGRAAVVVTRTPARLRQPTPA